jgi:hypothetical protein
MTRASIVFVRGTGRCGSKTLAASIARHPEVAKVPVNQCLPEELIDWSREHLQRRNPGVTDEAVAASCRAYFDAYCRTLGTEPGVLLHKGTMNMHRMASLLEIWPDARIVYIVRHPLGVVPAYVSVDIACYHGAYGYAADTVNSALRWYNDVVAFTDSGLIDDPRVHVVRFEDMVADPKVCFEGIDGFLGLSRTVPRTMPGAVPYDEEFVLSADERRWLLEVTADLTASLGYADDDRSAEVPAALQDRVHLHADRRPAFRPDTLDAAELVGAAIGSAVRQGARRVALLGAGYCARLAVPRLGDLACEPVCILDDDPARAGGKVGGVAIERAGAAEELDIDAVVPLTFVHQGPMMEQWRDRHPSIPIVPLLPEPAAKLASNAHA